MTLPDVSADLEATAKRVQELADQVAAKAKENGLSWLEGYEKVLKNLLDLEEKPRRNPGLIGRPRWRPRMRISSGKPLRCSSRA